MIIMKLNAEKLRAVATPMTEEEKARMTYRSENADWLRMSAAIALKIRKTLRQRGVSQAEFASRMNVTPAQVSKLLSGKVNFELKTLLRIQSVLGEPIINIAHITESETEQKNNSQVVFVYVKSEAICTKSKADADTCFQTYKFLG